jgi:hypothetical protein
MSMKQRDHNDYLNDYYEELAHAYVKTKSGDTRRIRLPEKDW